ncbi:uncharacterized protein LOC119666666 [Teleopsis dalmanni]|uniref:uncharacterized protein LOC119666666 n=1 Tax=Teleopsis dalmanni TaxID=139649 RepID=UPI0018CD888B|nr:uncharacterized protein LOC119666666 [Teleopsis dalmanni]
MIAQELCSCQVEPNQKQFTPEEINIIEKFLKYIWSVLTGENGDPSTTENPQFTNTTMSTTLGPNGTTVSTSSSITTIATTTPMTTTNTTTKKPSTKTPRKRICFKRYCVKFKDDPGYIIKS